MNMAEIIAAGMEAIKATADTQTDTHESQTICALAWAVRYGGFEGDVTDEQLNWLIAAIRTAYLCGKERRQMFKGYG
jgi:hypothetical protein